MSSKKFNRLLCRANFKNSKELEAHSAVHANTIAVNQTPPVPVAEMVSDVAEPEQQDRERMCR